MPLTIHTVTAANAATITKTMGRKALITRLMSLPRADMSGRIMNQEQGIAKRKGFGVVTEHGPYGFPGSRRSYPLTSSQDIPRALVVIRRIDVKKEMFCAGQIGEFAKLHPTSSNVS